MAKDNDKMGQEALIKEQLEALTRLQNNLQQIFTSDAPIYEGRTWKSNFRNN